MTAKEPPKTFNPDTHGAFTLKTGNGREKVYPYRKQDMFLEQAKHVVRCFDNDEQPLVTAQDGIDALKVANAVLEAGRKQATIKIR
jgi:predicted dehydrogenase